MLLALAALAPGQALNGHLNSAHAAEAAGDFKTAEGEYRLALKMHPDADTYLRLGLVCHLQNRFREAIRAFKSSLERQPDQWSARLFLGMDLYRSNDFAGAEQELRYAQRLKPGDYETRFWMGVTQLALKQYFPGLQTLESLSKEKPGDVEVLRILAENYAAVGASLLNRVAENHPNTPEGMLVHAHALEFEGASEAALDVYREIESRWPNREGVRAAIERLQAKPSSPNPPVPEGAGDAPPIRR